MPNASFVQTDFRGGLWSSTSQGRMDHPLYKTALNACLNSLPSEDGAWTRRPGFRFIGLTRNGLYGRLLPFRFSREQAYQAELTAGKIRFIAGLVHVKDETSEPIVMGITDDAQAVVQVNDIPAAWADGDIVMFNIESNPPSTYDLFGRQFQIANIDDAANTFKLKDPFTLVYIDGADIDWVPRATPDTVQRVLEFTTPYTAADIPNIRIVQDSDTVVLFLCPGRPPQSLAVSGATQFTFAEADFLDGPYLDENELVTTLALSAITGTVTVTASGTAGINDGDGFKTTDVGRQIWFQGGPPAWDNAIPYNKEDKVLGSDGNIYKSLISNNLGNNPTTDTGTKWEITSETVSVTWLEIATFVDTTHVTALIRGTAPDSGTATIHWRLGAYSNTTGFPTCGAYHEARLSLAGAVPNRVDQSMSFKALRFSPTETDGTVSDNNGVSFTLNNRDSEIVSWMLSTEEGLVIGTLAGEWVFRASALDDPISPTSAQARNPTNFGTANIEPAQVYGSPMFVQARGRKLMTHRRLEGKFTAINHSEKAEGITVPSIKEIAWVQEPLLTCFCRLDDGKLVGVTHRVANSEVEGFTGWHEHEHGLSRKFEALSPGPNFSGTSDSAFVITAHGTAPNANPRWIETMMPGASSGAQDWVCWHTDGSTTGWYIRRMIVANGDSFDGLRVFGLHNLNGITVHPYIAGLDLGNFVVANGRIDLPYSGTFTAAFLEAASDLTIDENYGIRLRWFDAPVTDVEQNPRNSILVYDDIADPAASGTRLLVDMDQNLGYRLDTGGPGGGEAMIHVFNGLTGALLSSVHTRAAIFPAEATHDLLSAFSFGEVWAYVMPDDDTGPRGALFGMSRGPNVGDNDLSLINANTLIEYDWVNTNIIPKQVFTIPYFVIDPLTLLTQYAQIGIVTTAAAAPVPIRIWNLTENGPLFPLVRFDSLYSSTLAGETIEWGCRGWEWSGHSTWFTWGHDGNVGIGMSNATRIQISEWSLDAPSTITTRVIRTITPAQVDAGWAAFDQFTVTYDANDGMLVCHAGKNAASASRVLKIDPITGDIIWNVATPTVMDPSAYPTMSAGPWRYNRWAYMTSAGVIQVLNLTDGTWSTLTGMATGFTSIGTQSWFDDFGPSLIVSAAFDGGVGSPSPSVNYIGAFAAAEQPSWVTNYDRIWLGLGYTQDQDHRELNAEYWVVPDNVGISFTSQGQLLRPDQGMDAGAARGPAFGKIRRIHEWAASFYRSFNVRVGTSFTKMFPVKFQTAGGTPYAAPTLFSGIVSDTLSDGYSFEGKLAWEVTRQYPCTITAIGGYISTQDK